VKAAARHNLFTDLLQGNIKNIDDLLHIDDVHTDTTKTTATDNDVNGSSANGNTALSDSPNERWSVTDATDKYAMYLHR
jgi:hypothetical protein